MRLNTDKTKVMFITTRQKRATLSVDGLALKSYDINLHLSNNERYCVYISMRFLFGMHILCMSQRRFRRIYGCCLKLKITVYFSLEHRCLFYNAYVKTHFVL